MSFRVGAEFDNITLKDLPFTGTKLSNIYNLRVVDGN
jgi:hypothetical protein